MRVAVVTPYYKESTEILRRCYESVQAQTHKKIVHLFVADGQPNQEIENWDCDHLVIRGPNHDAGNMARGIGALRCVAHGFDAVAFLDADNWYMSDHIESMISLVTRTKAAVGAAVADAYHMDGTLIEKGTPPKEVVAVDTNCFFLTKAVYPLLPLWMHLSGDHTGLLGAETQRQWSLKGLIGDKIFTYALKTFNIPIAAGDHSTVCYTVKSALYYEKMGIQPPEGAIRDEDLLEAWNWWQALKPEERTGLVMKSLSKDLRPQKEG